MRSTSAPGGMTSALSTSWVMTTRTRLASSCVTTVARSATTRPTDPRRPFPPTETLAPVGAIPASPPRVVVERLRERQFPQAGATDLLALAALLRQRRLIGGFNPVPICPGTYSIDP